MKKRRTENKPGSSTGRERQALYTAGVAQIKLAISEGFFLEAITLSESFITDRLEARWAWINQQSSNARQFRTLGQVARDLLGKKSESEEARKTYELAVEWSKGRNEAIHEMFKHAENCAFLTWTERYSGTASIATNGLLLARRTDLLVRKLNKFDA